MTGIKKPYPSKKDLEEWSQEVAAMMVPFERFRLRLRNCCVPTYRMYDAGHIWRMDDGLTPEMKLLDDQIKVYMQQIRELMEKRFVERFDVS